MQRHLFLTGAESAVCAQMLREALGAHMMEAGGFVTLREESGLSLIPAAGAAGADGFEPLRFLTHAARARGFCARRRIIPLRCWTSQAASTC